MSEYGGPPSPSVPPIPGPELDRPFIPLPPIMAPRPSDDPMPGREFCKDDIFPRGPPDCDVPPMLRPPAKHISNTCQLNRTSKRKSTFRCCRVLIFTHLYTYICMHRQHQVHVLNICTALIFFGLGCVIILLLQSIPC